MVRSRVPCATPPATRYRASMGSGRNFSPAEVHPFTFARVRSSTARTRMSPLDRVCTTSKRGDNTFALRSACSA
eukprot:4715511-Pyramimonas_sp.AAC.1